MRKESIGTQKMGKITLKEASRKAYKRNQITLHLHYMLEIVSKPFQLKTTRFKKLTSQRIPRNV